MAGPDWSFARRPAWLASHLFAAVVIVLCVLLGLWQLDRLDQRQRVNDLIRDRSTRPASTVDRALLEGGPDELNYVAVRDTGTYVPDEQVVIRSRSQGEAAGSWVVTPLRTSAGTTVLVNRGFVPDVQAAPEEVPVPAGPVEVTGWLRRSERRGPLGPRDPAEGRLAAFARIDVARLDAQIPGELAPVWLQLATEAPPPGPGSPDPVPLLDLGEGPHLSYAIQWFTFATLGVIVYGLLLRRRSRELPGGQGPDGDDRWSDPAVVAEGHAESDGAAERPSGPVGSVRDGSDGTGRVAGHAAAVRTRREGPPGPPPEGTG
jgi:surfeit locus 1 family protein